MACEDVRAVAKDVLRHRVLINFHGQAEGFTPDHVIGDVLDQVAVPVQG
ncbi:MAG: hypothetical protein R3F30_03590 [Planctomycetota bacterium]